MFIHQPKVIKKTNLESSHRFYFIVKGVDVKYFKSFIQSIFLQKYLNWHCLFVSDDVNIIQNIKFYTDFLNINNKISFCDSSQINGSCFSFLNNDTDIVCLINMNMILSNGNILTVLNNIYNNFHTSLIINNTTNNNHDIKTFIKPGNVTHYSIQNSDLNSIFITISCKIFKIVLKKYKTTTQKWFENNTDNYIVWVSLYLAKENYYLNNNISLIKNKYIDLIKNEYDINNNNNNKFTFIICSYNNEKYIERNLYSVINQRYNNWNVIYINDNSTDKTEELFKDIIKTTNTENKFLYIKNAKQMKQMYNKYYAYKLVGDFNIVCILDGDDWLSHNNVLDELNYYYNKYDYKLICSNFVYYDGDSYKIKKYYDYSDIDKKYNNLRYNDNWYFSHLKTGYGYLFKSIPRNYIKYNNKWLDRCTDWAETFSASELAKGNIKLLEDYYYIYNKENSIQYDSSYYNDASDKRCKIENYLKMIPICKFELPQINIINMKEDIKKKISIIKQLNYLKNDNFLFHNAVNGNKETYVKELIDFYDNLQNYEILDEYRSKFNSKRKHITKSSLGLILSVFNIFKDFIVSDKEHLLLMEDDIYCLKDIHSNIFINEEVLKHKDIVYLGCQNNRINLYDTYVDGSEIFVNIKNINEIIYGTYSIIISKKIAQKIIDLGIYKILKLNLSFDILLNYIRFIDEDIEVFLYFKQLFIPEVRKDGINGVRTNEFYKSRNIDLNNYYL